MSQSILNAKYIEPNRPYSKKELDDLRQDLFKKLKISSCVAFHTKCNHSYKVRSNGKKEKDIQNNNNNGNCSVCWKFNKTSNNLKKKADDLIYEFNQHFSTEPLKYNYDLLDLETTFYKWLYLD